MKIIFGISDDDDDDDEFDQVGTTDRLHDFLLGWYTENIRYNCSHTLFSDFYTLFESKLAENHTLHSGTYRIQLIYGSTPPPGGFETVPFFLSSCPLQC